MKTKDLKLFALEYINLQDGLTQDDKLALMGFVTEGTREQVMSMMFTGQMRDLEEGEDKFVSELFEVSNVGGFITEALTLQEADPWLKIMDPNDPAWKATRSAIKGVLNTAYKGNKAMVQKMMAPENVAGLKGVLKTAVDGNVKGAKAVMSAIKGKGSLFGASAFSKAAHGKDALGDSGAIKALASKWASFKVPDVKQLGGLTIGKGDSAAVWGKNYNTAIDALNKGVPVAAAVVAALVIMLSRKAYKAYLTKAARACKGTKGEEKNECIRKFKVDAVKAQVGVLNKAKAACKSTKSPETCSAKIDQKIQKKQIEIKKLMAKKKVR